MMETNSESSLLPTPLPLKGTVVLEYGSCCTNTYSSANPVVDNQNDCPSKVCPSKVCPPKVCPSLLPNKDTTTAGGCAKSVSKSVPYSSPKLVTSFIPKSFLKRFLTLGLIVSVLFVVLNHSGSSNWIQSALILSSAALSGTKPATTAATANDSTPSDDDETGQKIVYIIRHGEKVRDPTNATAYFYACLSAKGRSRADHLVETFGSSSSSSSNLVTPTGLVSFNYDNHGLDCLDGDGVYRTEATLLPLGRALGIPIDNHHGAKPDMCGLGTIEDTPGISDDDDDDDNDGAHRYNHRVCHHPRRTGSVHDFGICCNIGAAAAIRKKLFELPDPTSSVLVAWEHANIGHLAVALMINNDHHREDDAERILPERTIEVAEFLRTNPDGSKPLHFPDDSFDAIWALWFDTVTQHFVRIDTTTYTQGFGD